MAYIKLLIIFEYGILDIFSFSYVANKHNLRFSPFAIVVSIGLHDCMLFIDIRFMGKRKHSLSPVTLNFNIKENSVHIPHFKIVG